MKRINKKGYSSVLMLSVIAVIAGAVILIYQCTEKMLETSYADSVFRLAGKSILTEYDRTLFKEYGLFGFKEDEKTLLNKVKKYSNVSFGANQAINLLNAKERDYLKVKAKNQSVSLKGYSLSDTELVRKQFLEQEKSFKGMLKTFSNLGKKREGEETNRTLRNEIVKEGLPSYGYFENMSWTDKIAGEFSDFISGFKDIGKAFKDKLDDSIVDIFIFSHFNSSVHIAREEDGFFQNELEYILEGKFNDKDNRESVFAKIMLVRIALNSAHIEMDAKKRTLVSTLSKAGEIIGPAGEALAHAGIVLAWASAEAENDIKLLEEGKKVAFIKSSGNWALSNPKKAIEGAFSGKTVEPKIETGQEYIDYLKALLFFTGEQEKLLRAMDLIQINMKNKYNEDFLLRDYYTGFSLTAEINKDKLRYDFNY